MISCDSLRACIFLGSVWVCVDVCRVFIGVCGCAQVYAGMHGCVQVCAGGAQVCVGVHKCPWVYTGLHWFVWVYAVAGVCMGACVYVWDEFSEYLLET